MHPVGTFFGHELKKLLTTLLSAGIITHVVRDDAPAMGGLAQLGARLVSKHTPSQIVLRQSNFPTKNSIQEVRFLDFMGGLAQLGERLHGMQEVSGSIPLFSTKKSTVLRLKYGAFLFAFLEVALKIIQMPDFAGAWTATPKFLLFRCF